jgi:hypothetical protein
MSRGEVKDNILELEKQIDNQKLETKDFNERVGKMNAEIVLKDKKI